MPLRRWSPASCTSSPPHGMSSNEGCPWRTLLLCRCSFGWIVVFVSGLVAPHVCRFAVFSCCCPTCGAVNFRECAQFLSSSFFFFKPFYLVSDLSLDCFKKLLVRRNNKKESVVVLSSLCTYTMPPKYVTV